MPTYLRLASSPSISRINSGVYVSNLEDVQLGDVVVTSGVDEIYPKGFVIGDVVRASIGPGLYRTIEVSPRVQFNDLEYVLVIVPEPSPRTAVGGG